MTTAREIMSAGADCVQTTDTVGDAARMMTRLQVGALPICGSDDKLKGVLTDRDIVTKVLGQGRDTNQYTAGDLTQDEAVTIGADDSSEEVLATMTRHRVRRLPVIDDGRLVGMVALADVGRSLSNPQVGDLVDALSAE